MSGSSAPETKPRSQPRRLAGPLAIAVIAVVLTVLLVLLFPGRRYKNAFQGGGVLDTASLSYLETMLKASPHDDAVRLAYAGQLLAHGELTTVQTIMKGLTHPRTPAARATELRLRMAQYSALEPGDPRRVEAKKRVQKTMTALAKMPAGQLTNAQIEKLAGTSLAFGLPGQAAQWYEVLARRHPGKNYQWWAQAGKWWLAAGKTDRASAAWRQALRSAANKQQGRAAAEQALAAATMAGGGHSMKLARRMLNQHPDSAALLQKGVDAALAANDPRQALVWVRHLAALKPKDDAIQRKLGQVLLANGDVNDALPVYEALAQRHPHDPGIQHRLAQLFTWTGHPDKALGYYERQARHHPTAANDRELVKLGNAAYDYPVVTAALLRQNARHRLSVPGMTELVADLDDQMGKPLRSAQVLEGWLTAAPEDYQLWRRLASIYAHTDQRARAIATWRRIIGFYGSKPADVAALAALQIEAWDLGGALKTLSSLLRPGRRPPASPAYWRNLGAVALQQGDMQTVARAYGWLYERQHGDIPESEASRLVTADLRLGNTDAAASIVQRTWQYHPSPALLMQVLSYAIDHGRTDLATQLFALAAAHPSAFDHVAQYWVLRGNAAFDHGRLDAARADYDKALAIDPDDTGARAALLSVLLTRHDRDALRRHLALWYADAAGTPQLWEVYALGYSFLGQPRTALSWYARRARAHPKDYLWLLSYADGLDAAGRSASAYRLRLYALTRLRPQVWKQAQRVETAAQRQRDYQVLSEQQALLGGDENLAWLRRVLEARSLGGLRATDLELLVDWHLSANQPTWARDWLLRARMDKLRMPEYQQLSVALAANNHHAIGQILARSTAPGVADRVAGWNRIRHNGKALLLALNHLNAGNPWSPGIQSLPRYAADDYQRMPQNVGTELVATRIGNLLLSTELGSVKRSSTHWTATAGVRATQLARRGIALILDGIHNEYAAWVKLEHRGRRSTTTVSLGQVDAGAGGFTQASLNFGYDLTHRLHADLFAHYNEQTLDSAYFRALGTRDSLGLDFDYTLTARDDLSVTAQALRYQSRWNDFLGTGYELGTTFNHALKRGQTYEVDAYAGVSYTHNNLVDRLPYRMYARMPTGSDVNTVLPDQFGFAGVGLAFSRGQPGTDYPTVDGLRYHADLGFGYVWPDDRLGFAFNGALGHRILGSDELSLRFGIDQTQNETGGLTWTFGLRYRYFLGK